MNIATTSNEWNPKSIVPRLKGWIRRPGYDFRKVTAILLNKNGSTKAFGEEETGEIEIRFSPPLKPGDEMMFRYVKGDPLSEPIEDLNIPLKWIKVEPVFDLSNMEED